MNCPINEQKQAPETFHLKRSLLFNLFFACGQDYTGRERSSQGIKLEPNFPEKIRTSIGKDSISYLPGGHDRFLYEVVLCWIGISKKNVLPLPNLLSAHTRPPCRSAIDFTIARPKPVPLCFFASRLVLR